MRSSIADAEQAEADAFAEALDAAAHCFTAKQQEQISELTGLTIIGEPASESEEAGKGGAGDDQEELDKQLAALKEEVEDPLKGIDAAKRRRMGLPVKQEEPEAARVPPDLSGRAAPETPAAAAARQWAANRRANRAGVVVPPQQASSFSSGFAKGGGKGGKSVRPPRRSWGIVSLDESSRLHGGAAGDYSYGQQSQKYFEQTAKFDEAVTPAQKRARELPKGTPTVAPMCPAPGEAGEEL